MNALSEELLQERRRSIRLRRSSLSRVKLDDIDRPNIKIAETLDELSQSFSLVYKEYLAAGYITRPIPEEMYFNIYNFLPKTCIFIFRSYTNVISTLTQIFDTKEFGLPMDVLYRQQLDELRSKGRKITELSALVSPKELRWCNLVIFLAKTMFEYSEHCKGDVDDICIMVNPKHVNFYKTIFLFEEFGPEKFYPAVGAPAIALRIDMRTIKEKGYETYKDFDLEGNLHSFFCKLNSTLQELKDGHAFVQKRHAFDEETGQFFYNMRKDLFTNLTATQQELIRKHYPFIYAAGQSS